METDVRFLEELERDLLLVAEQERERLRKPPTRRSNRWKSWLGAAASLLVLAFAIGALAQLGGGGTTARPASGSFAAVGALPPAPQPTAPGLAPGLAHGDQGAVTGRYGVDKGAGSSSGRGTSQGQTGADLTKIVRDGTIAIAVPDGSFDSKRAKIVAIANAHGGFVLTSQTQGSSTGTFTIRVPASRFDTAMAQVSELGTVESSSVTGKDVTNQYIDYKAHLKNLMGRRTVLRGLLLQTTTIGESLAVENQLEDVQLQIDQIQGELRYLKNQVEEATLTIDLREESAPAGEAETNGAIHNPSLSRAWDRAVQGFFGIIATTIVGLGYLLPVAVVAGVIYGLVTLVRRRGRAAS
jgi:Domain of unknown function (DUF4349)